MDRKSTQGGQNEEMGAGTFRCENQSISPLSPLSLSLLPSLSRNQEGACFLSQRIDKCGAIASPEIAACRLVRGKHSLTRFKEKTKFTELQAPGLTQGKPFS